MTYSPNTVFIKSPIGIRDTVVLIHGWTSSPETVRSLGEALNDQLGYNIVMPTLPGHNCSDAKSFLDTNYQDWIDHANEECYKLAHDIDYKIIGIGGLSMGAVIASLIATELNIKKVALISPAFFNKSALSYLVPFLRFFVSKFPKEKINWPRPYAEFRDTDYMKKQLSVYQKYHWILPAWNLLKVQEVGRDLFGDLKPKKCIAIMSITDESVSPRSLQFIKSNYCGENLEIMETSLGNHELLNDIRVRATVISRLVGFFHY